MKNLMKAILELISSCYLYNMFRVFSAREILELMNAVGHGLDSLLLWFSTYSTEELQKGSVQLFLKLSIWEFHQNPWDTWQHKDVVQSGLRSFFFFFFFFWLRSFWGNSSDCH